MSICITPCISSPGLIQFDLIVRNHINVLTHRTGFSSLADALAAARDYINSTN